MPLYKTLEKVTRGSWTAERRIMKKEHAGCAYEPSEEPTPYVVVYLTKSEDRVDHPIRYDDGQIGYNDYNPPRDKRRAVEAVMPPAN